MTTSQQQQALRILGEFKQLERHPKGNLARLSAVATDFLNQFEPIQIHKWDPGKYISKLTWLNLVIKR